MKRVIPLMILSIVFPCLFAEEYPKSIIWKGYEWNIKASRNPLSPGPNYFSQSLNSLWMDDKGLHLTIRKQGERWLCSEVICKTPAGYGHYEFSFDINLGEMPPHAVLGFFTWDESPDDFHREIDTEIAAWGKADFPQGQFVIQPFEQEENRHIFTLVRERGSSSFLLVINWERKGIRFNLKKATGDKEQFQWFFPGEVDPGDGNVRVHINLWLYEGNKQEIQDNFEVLVSDFRFIPEKGDLP